MNRIRLAGVCLLAALATCAVTAASASAQAPEFGRCLRLMGEQAGQGAYANNSCTSPSAGKTGRFEWFPGAAKASFTTKSKEGAKVFFEGVNHTRVTCAGETSSGEYTTPKLEEDVVFRFTGCETMGLAVSSEGAATGEVVSNPTECELGVLEQRGTARMDRVGLTCAEESAFMWMKWGGYGLPVEWCLRGWWFFTPTSNRMESTDTMHSRQTNGMQYWDKFVEGPLEPLEASFNGGTTWERAALTDTTVQSNEEPIEINSVA